MAVARQLKVRLDSCGLFPRLQFAWRINQDFDVEDAVWHPVLD